MTTMNSNTLLEAIIHEIDKGANQTDQMIALQNELSQYESDLTALQVRFTHKTRENEDLKITLASKSKLLNEKLNELKTKSDRLEWLEFHYDDLIQKYKLCMDCMSKMKKENQELENKLNDLQVENSKAYKDKHQLKEIFRDQIDDIDDNLNGLIRENENHLKLISDLRENCERLQNDLNGSIELNKNLVESKEQLRVEFDEFKNRMESNLGAQITKNDELEGKCKLLEVDLLRYKSEIDETNLQLSQMTANYQSQLKQNDSLKNFLKQKEIQYSELKENYENFLVEYKHAKQNYFKEKDHFENKLKELTEQNELTAKELDIQKSVNENQNKLYHINTKKLNFNISCQQEKIDTLLLTFKDQKIKIKSLQKKMQMFKEKYETFKASISNWKELKLENDEKIKMLEEKCKDLEQKYAEKCDHLNSLEKETYITRNSLDNALNEMTNIANALSNKNNELIHKNKTIDQLESVIGQQSNELNKRKIEIDERIQQIEKLEKCLSEEKIKFELKLTTLDSSLKSKSKQLHQRIDQVKDMNMIVDEMKSKLEQFEYKIKQLENVNKCQQLEIDSKQSILKQYELRIQDSVNELNSVKFDLEQERTKNEFKNELRETFSKLDQTTNQETQTNESSNHLNNRFDINNQQLSAISELAMKLELKDKHIESIRDEIVLKEAEITRLKSKIILLERKSINEDEDEYNFSSYQQNDKVN